MIKLVRQDVENYLTLTLEELYSRYPEHPKRQIQYIRKKLTRLSQEGKLDMEQYPEQHDNLKKIADILERSGIDPEVVQHIDRIHSGTYEVITNSKNAEGVEEVKQHTNRVENVRWVPKQAESLESFITQAKPTKITPTKTKRVRIQDLQAFALADIHGGFRKYLSGEIDPTHDEAALDVGQQIVKDNQPDEIILLGDNLDLPMFSRFQQELSMSGSFQMTLDWMHQYLAQLRANAPNARIIYLEGNHERRLLNSVKNNNANLFNIKPANMPESWGVVTVPFLLRLKELEVEWVGAYPGGRYWLNDRLACLHGDTARQLGRTASAIISKSYHSSVFGHIHRTEFAERTVPDRHTAKIIGGYCCGTAGARIDGAVPGHKTATNEDERITPNYENWQQGIAHIAYQKGDRPFQVTPIRINTLDDHEARFGGRIYTPWNTNSN